MFSSAEMFNGILKIAATIAILIFLISGGLGILLGRTVWGGSDYIESKTKIEPAIKLTTDGKKVDTLYVYKIK